MELYIWNALNQISTDILYDNTKSYDAKLHELIYVYRELTFATYFHVMDINSISDNDHIKHANIFLNNTDFSVLGKICNIDISKFYKYTASRGGIERTSMHHMNMAVNKAIQ